MPTRSRSHVLEDESKSAFRGLLPQTWVYRDKSHDYGIDGEVELFKENGRSTGMIFYVQIKGTDESDVGRARKAILRLDTYRYFATLNYPVLIVRYLSAHKKFYVRWSHAKLEKPPKQSQKTFTFRFYEDDEVNTDAPQEIEKTVHDWMRIRNQTPELPIHVHVETDACFDLEMSEADFLRSAAALTANAKKDIVTFIFGQSESAFGALRLYRDKSVLLIGGGCASATLESIQEHPGGYETFIAEVYISLGRLVSHFRHESLAHDLILPACNSTPVLKHRPDLLTDVALMLYKTRSYDSIKGVFERVLCDDTMSRIQILVILFYSFSSQRGREELNWILTIHAMLRNYAESQGAPEKFIGTAEYNIGNVNRRLKNYLVAVRSYHRAIKLEPLYRDKAYWWGEVAGCLFLKRRYRKASAYYARALDLDKSNTAMVALHADSLLFAGRYQSSLDRFRSYLDDSDEPATLWLLKHMCLDNLAGKWLDTAGRDTLASQQLLAGAGKNIDEKTLEKALLLDLCNSDAWFEMGMLAFEQKKFSEGLMPFIWAAIVKEQRTDAWVNAFLHAFSAKDEPLIGAIMDAAYDSCGQRFTDELFGAIDECVVVSNPEELKKVLLEAISTLEGKKRPRPLEVRFFDSDLPPLMLG